MQRSLWSRAIIASSLLLLLLLGGCGIALKLAYNQGPTLTYWWLDGYIDFDDDQRPRVKAQIDQWFRWNRRQQMPEYAELFARAATQVQDPVLTPQAMCSWAAEGRQRLWGAFDAALPAAAELALSLTPQQVANVEKRFAKNNRKFRDQFLDGDRDDRIKAQVKKVVERAEMVYGDLDASQRERITQGVASSPYDPEAWLAERRLIQQELVQVLRQLQGKRPDDPQALQQAQAALKTVAQHADRSPREAYRQQAQRVWDYDCAFAAQVHNAAKPAQRTHAVERFKRWEEDARGLYAQAAR